MGHGEWINKSDAVSLIAEHCYPNAGDPRNTKNKSRRRIDTAVKAKKLKQFQDGSSWKFDRYGFLQWAVTTWPELRKSLSIPHAIERKTASFQFTGFSPIVHVTPSDPMELLVELNKCRNTIEEQRAEIDRLRVIESDWTAREEQDQLRRKKQGEHGKKGRGIEKN